MNIDDIAVGEVVWVRSEQHGVCRLTRWGRQNNRLLFFGIPGCDGFQPPRIPALSRHGERLAALEDLGYDTTENLRGGNIQTWSTNIIRSCERIDPPEGATPLPMVNTSRHDPSLRKPDVEWHRIIRPDLATALRLHVDDPVRVIDIPGERHRYAVGPFPGGHAPTDDMRERLDELFGEEWRNGNGWHYWYLHEPYNRGALEPMSPSIAQSEGNSEEPTITDAHRADIDRIGRILAREAENRNWCAVYDEVVSEINCELTVPLSGRTQQYRVTYLPPVAPVEVSVEFVGPVGRAEVLDWLRANHPGATLSGFEPQELPF